MPCLNWQQFAESLYLYTVQGLVMVYFPKSCGKLLGMRTIMWKKLKIVINLSILTPALISCSSLASKTGSVAQPKVPAVASKNKDLDRKAVKENRQFASDRTKILKASGLTMKMAKPDSLFSSRLELGHLALKQKKYGEALTYFNGIIAKSKNSKEVRQAYLGKLQTFQGMRLAEQAKSVAEMIQQKYPNSEEAQVAKDRILINR